MSDTSYYARKKEESDKKIQEALDARNDRKENEKAAQASFAERKKASDSKVEAALSARGQRIQSSLPDIFSDINNQLTVEINSYKGTKPTYGAYDDTYKSQRERRISISNLRNKVNAYRQYMDSSVADNIISTLDQMEKGYDAYLGMSKYETQEDYDTAVRQYGWQQKYQGKGYFELQDIMRDLEEGSEEYNWLNSYSMSVITPEETDKAIARANMAIDSGWDYINKYGEGSLARRYNNHRDEMTEEELSMAKVVLDKYGSFEKMEEAVKKSISRNERILWNMENHKKYGYLSENDDFKEVSSDVATELPSGWGAFTADATYLYINDVEGYRITTDAQGAIGGRGNTYAKYDYMTDGEIADYNYLYNKEGKASANDYLKSLEEKLNYRQAAGRFELLEGNTGLELLFGIEAGLDQFGSGIKNLFNTEDRYIPASSTQMLSGMVREDLADDSIPLWYNAKTGEWEDKVLGSSLGQIGYDAITTTSNMAPSILTSMAVGMINPTLGAVTGNALLGASAAGNAYTEKLNLGYTPEQARTYGILVGTSEAVLQYALGGVSKLGGNVLTKTALKNLDAVDNVFARFAQSAGGKILLNAGSEAFEEGLQAVIEPYLWQAVSGEEASVDWQETLYNALMGFATGGMFEAVGVGGTATIESIENRQQNTATGRAIMETEGGVDALMMLADEMAGVTTGKEQQNLMKQTEKVSSKMDSGSTSNRTARKVAKLYDTVKGSFTTQNHADIVQALTRGENSFSTKEANKIAGALVAQSNGLELTQEQSELLESVKSNPAVLGVVESINSENTLIGQRNQQLRQFRQDVTVNAINKAITKQVTEKEFTPEGVYETSSGNKAIRTDTNEEIDIKGVKEIGNGKLVLELSDGSTIDAKSVSFATEADALIYEAVGKLGDNIDHESANQLIAQFKGGNAMVFARGIAQAYTYGFYGVDKSELFSKHSLADKLTDAQRDFAYDLGKKYRPTADKKAKDRASEKMAKTGKTPGEKGVYYRDKDGNATDISTYLKTSGIKLNDMQKTGIEAMRKMSEMMGVRFNVFESWVENGKRYYLDENGDVVEGNPNGFYDTTTGEIYIDLNAGNDYQGTMLFTIAHEVTHFMRQWSPEHFTKIAEIVFQHGGMKGNVSELVALKQAKAKKKGKPISYDTAMEEVVADGMETILKDGKVVEFMADVKKKDHAAWEKLKGWFKNLAKFLRKMIVAYRGQSAQTTEGAKVAEFSQDLLSQIEQIYAEGAVEAGDSYRAAQAQFSTANMQGNADGAVVQSDATTAAMESTSKEQMRTEYEALPKQVMSLSDGAGTLLNSIEGLTPTKLKGLSGRTVNGYTGRDVRAWAMGINGFTKAQIQEVNKFMDSMADFMEEAGVTYKFIGLQDVKDAKLHYTYNSDGSIKSIVLSAMVKNGDYPVNFDLSSICKKREAMSKLIDKLAKRGSLDNGTVKLTPANIFRINTALKDAGYETACLGCFVESKRYNSLEWAKKFCNKWNAAVKKVNPNATYFGYGDATFSEDSFTLEQAVKIEDAANKYIKATKTERLANALKKYQAKAEAGLPLVESFSKAARDRLIKSDISDALKDKYLNSDVTTWNMADVEFLLENGILPGASLSNKQAVTEMVKSGEAYQHLLRPSDLLTDRGISKLEALPNFHGVLYGHYGSGTPKLMQSYTPYNSEIALLPANKNKDQSLAEYLYTIAGVRMQSFSDFQIQNIYDYLQMVADLTARKLPAHAYTKEISFAKLLGMTGIKTNLSVMFDIDPMVDKAHAGLTKLNKLVHRGEYAKVVLEDAQGKWVYNIGDYQTQKMFAEAFPDEAKRFLQSIGFADAVKLQTTPGYSANCGIIGVGYSDLGIFAMLDDNRIRYIIPYHASSLPSEIKVATNIALGTDYTPYQNNMKIKEIVDRNGNKVNWTIKEAYKRLGNGQAVINELNEKIRTEGWVVSTTKAQTGHGSYGLYENLQETNDPRQTASNFMDWCIGNGTLPLFYQFASHENYYKMLYDYNVYDCVTEEYAPQQAVTNTYPTMVDGQVQPGNVTDGDFNTEYFQGTIEKQMAFMDEYSRNRDADIEKLAENMEEGNYSLFSDRDTTKYADRDFNEHSVAVALYDALDHSDEGYDNLIRVSSMPKYIVDKLGIDGDFYIYRDHAYENMVSEEQAIADGRPTHRKGKKLHFHNHGIEKMTQAILSINDPTMTIATKTKHGNPAVIMLLPEFGKNKAPLYAVLSFYSDEHIGGSMERKPHIVLTIAERNFFEEGGRAGIADIVKSAIDDGRVIDFNKKRRDDLSVIANPAGVGNITDASLIKNLSHFRNEVNAFRAQNGIKYSERVTDQETLASLNEQLKNGEVTKVYRAMQVQPVDENGDVIKATVMEVVSQSPLMVKAKTFGKDGKVAIYPAKLFSPMAGMVNGKWSKSIDLNEWEQTTYDLANAYTVIDEKTGKPKIDNDKKNASYGEVAYFYGLVKGGIDDSGKKLTDVPARYNPYIHTSLSALNDQFSSANKRPELVTVECIIPNSELTSGERAEGAKDRVGAMSWHSGPTSSRLAKVGKARTVILTRYDMPVRVLPDSEVAKAVAEYIGDTENIAIKGSTVTPSLSRELMNLGISVLNEEQWSQYDKDFPTKTFGKKKSTTRYSDRDNAPTFYSQMAKVVDGMKQEKFGASSVVSMLRGRGVKAEEIKWSGIEEWLAGKKSVTKAELQDFIAGSMLQIEEEQSGRATFIADDGNTYESETAFKDAAYAIADRNGIDRSRVKFVIDTEYDMDAYAYVGNLNNTILTAEVSDVEGISPRWGQYKLDGGENYREIVFRMPNSTYTNKMMQVHWGSEAEGVLAHARIQDFNTFLGKMLFIEEIQSDWHNEGHKSGYKKPGEADKAEIALKMDKFREKFFESSIAKVFEERISSIGYEGAGVSMMLNYLLDETDYTLDVLSRKGVSFTESEKSEIDKYVREYGEMHKQWENAPGEFTAPDAPFSDTYHEYVLKRLIRMAAEQEYDSIGWTTADIQSDRWSEQFAEGYRIEYDQDIPKFMSKYGKKWGTRVGKTTLDSGTEVWSMAITDSMKDSVLTEGQPLYQDRTDDSVSNRSLLANALEGAAKNEIEKAKIQEYKGKVDLIDAEEKKLRELNEQIKELSFSKGPRDTKKIRDLRDEATMTANRISTYDKQLLRLEASKPLQDVLAREKKKAYDRAIKKGRDALAEYKEKTAKTQRELLNKWKESRKKAVESRERTVVRHKIQSVVGELNDLLLSNDKKRHVPDSLKKSVADALALVNMDTVGAEERAAKYAALIANETDPDKIDAYTTTMENILRQGEKMGQRLKELRDAYEEIQNSDDPDIANAYDPVIAGALSELSQTIGNTSLRNMTIEQLEDVYTMYKMVLTRVRDANKSLIESIKESISNRASRVVGEVRRAGGEHKYRASILDPIRSFFWNNAKPVYAMEHIGSDAMTEAFNQVRKGEDTWAKDVTEARAYYLDKSKKYGYDSWDFDKKYTFKSASEQEFELTLEQILSLYAYSKREQAHDHLRLGGFVFDSNIETYKDGKFGSRILKYKVNTADAHQITPEILANITGTLTSDQMAFVDEMQDYLSTVMGAKGNEVTMKMYGVKLFKEKFYFPLKSAKQFMFEQNEVSGEVRIKNSGFTNKVVAKANNPVILNNFMDVWANHVNDMSMYHSFVLPLEDFNRIFNYNSPKQEGKPPVSVKGTIQSAYSPAAVNYVKQLITDLNGGARSDPRETFAKSLTAKFKKAKVFSSLSVVIQQPSAIGRAFALVDPKYFHPTVDGMNHDELWAELKRYAPVAIIKEMGYFDTNMGKSTQDFIRAKEYTTFKEKAKAIFTDSDYRDEILSKAPALADELTWCAIWNAVKRETLAKNPGLDSKSEPFLMLAGARFTEVVTKTQVYDSVLSRSANMRSKSGLMSMITSFMAEPTTSINMLEDALRKGKRGFKGYAARAFASVAVSVILNNALVALVYAGRDDDEDETYAEKYMQSFVSGMLDDINPLTYLPFVKDMWSVLQGYDVERSDMSLVSDLADALKGLVKAYTTEDGEVAEAWWTIAGAVANIGGVPMENIRREINGAINFFNTVIEDVNGRATTWGSMGDAIETTVKDTIPVVGWLPSEAKSDKLYDAIISGDTAYVNRLKGSYKTEDAYHSAVRTALRENDPRIMEAARAGFNGDPSERVRIAKLIIADGFAQDDVVAAINAEINKMKPDEPESDPKVKGFYTTEDFVREIVNGDHASANAVKVDVIQTAQKNGKTAEEAEERFNSSAKSELKEMYLAGKISRDKVISAMTTYCGVDKDDAVDDVDGWDFKKKYGFNYSERAEAYKTGNITASQLKAVLMSNGGMSEEEADLQIEAYDWEKQGYDGATIAAVRQYKAFCASSNVPKDVYLHIRSFSNNTENDKDANGKTIYYSAMKKVMAEINAQYGLTSAQKDAIARSLGWAEKNISKYKPW